MSGTAKLSSLSFSASLPSILADCGCDPIPRIFAMKITGVTTPGAYHCLSCESLNRTIILHYDPDSSTDYACGWFFQQEQMMTCGEGDVFTDDNNITTIGQVWITVNPEDTNWLFVDAKLSLLTFGSKDFRISIRRNTCQNVDFTFGYDPWPTTGCDVSGVYVRVRSYA